MDDEDRSDFGIAPQKIQNSAKFRKEKDDLERKRKHIPSNLNADALIPGEPVLDQFIKPAQETIGECSLDLFDFFSGIKKYPLRGYILGVLTHTNA